MKKGLKIEFVLLLLLGLLATGGDAMAQSGAASDSQKVLLGGLVVGKDTFPVDYLPMIFVEGQLNPQERARLANLRYNVAKVYPYAVTAAYVLNKVDEQLDMRHSRHSRKAYIKATQKALSKKFKGKLKNLTITQGKILVKLINRETGRDCYDVIKELRGGLNARIFQTVAFLFDNDLKAQYDPYGKDRDIEMIVQEIEAKNYYRYQSQIMEQNTALEPAKK